MLLAPLSISRSTNPSSTSGGSVAPSSWASSTTTAWWSRPSFSALSSLSLHLEWIRTAAPALWTLQSTCSASAWSALCSIPADSILTEAPAKGSWTVSSSTFRQVSSLCLVFCEPWDRLTCSGLPLFAEMELAPSLRWWMMASACECVSKWVNEKLL